MSYSRETWVEVDLDAVAHNVACVKAKHPNKTLMAVVKANAYGHGDVEVGKVALASGADQLAVSSFDEAMNLRRKGIEASILVMGVTKISDLLVASEQEISITVHDVNYMKEALQLPLKKALKVHLKIDSGMNRIGVSTLKDITEAFGRLVEHPLVELEGIFTHMATADDNLVYLKDQIVQFRQMTAYLDLSKVKYVHVENSATLLQFDFDFTNAIRLGISIYGVNPGGAFIPLDFELKPTLALYSTLVQVKQVRKGEKIGYSATYEAKEDEWIGTLPIGYADGWIRQHQGRSVIVNGMACEIVGRVCMDQMMIRLPEEVPAGTRVTLIGEGMPVERVAEEMATISYETFCLISDRVPRVYKQKGQVTDVNSMRFQI